MLTTISIENMDRHLTRIRQPTCNRRNKYVGFVTNKNKTCPHSSLTIVTSADIKYQDSNLKECGTTNLNDTSIKEKHLGASKNCVENFIQH